MSTDPTPKIDETGEPGETLNRARAILDDLRASVSPEQAAQLDELAALLDEVAIEAGWFTWAVAHDLIVHAITIAGFAELMLNHPDLEADKQERFLETIRDKARHQAQLFETYRHITLVKLGYMPSTSSERTLQEVMGCEFAKVVEAHGHGLLLDIPGDLPTLWTDSFYTHWVISELIYNACRFTPDGGTITVKAEAVPGGVRVAVSDTGIGIPPDELPRVFKGFYLGSHPMAQERRGYGMGLYIARGLARLLGGDLSVESVLDEGSTFSFTLPAAT
jgi:signal transduction histidine kinase